MNTAAYWEYDTRLGRRWNVDPVKKPWQSDYACFSNSPIWKVDPDGDDDYFNSQGKLILRTGIGTSIKVVTGNQVHDFSKLPLDQANNRQLATSIAAYYAGVVGVGAAGGTVGIKDAKSKVSDKNPAFTTGKEIYLNSKGGITPLLNDYNNMMSTFEHELDHLKKGHGEIESSSFEHSEVYLTQMSSSTFAKTTGDFKTGTSHSAANWLTFAASGIALGIDKEHKISDLNDLIGKFNEQSSKTGYTFSMTKNKEGEGYTVTANKVKSTKGKK